MLAQVAEWDFIIIGGGIVGCSAAYYLARTGARTLLVERDDVASTQSGRNLGFVRQQGRDFRELELAIEANRIWRGLEAELGRSVGWMQGGQLAVAATPEGLTGFETWTRRARDYGLDTRMVTPAEMAELSPLLRRDYLGGMYTASDGKADPVMATRAYAEAARANGATIAVGRGVDSIETQAGAVTGIRIGDRLLKAKTVICAAGAGTSALLRRVGLSLPQDVIRATVVRTEPTQVKLDVGLWGLSVGIRQSKDGTIHMSHAGGDYDVRFDSLRYARWFAKPLRQNAQSVRLNFLHPLQRLAPRGQFDCTDIPPSSEKPQASSRRARQAFEEFTSMVPSLAELRILSIWAGYIDNTPDLIPAIGGTNAARGLVIATGFSGHGFCAGPAAGKAVADLAVTGKPAAYLRDLSPDRFADGTWSGPQGAL